MCNYNMADTLERSLTSILDNVDDRFEVVLVDDGSCDKSVDVAKALHKKYPNLRLVCLPRDPNRKLGLTRNISIENSSGEYVILHMDADDVWEPYINDFVGVFHRLEECLGRDVLLAGQQINIGRKSFLVKHGPYRNIRRGEDRDMWMRFAAMDAYVPLSHKVFRSRLPRPRRTRLFKSVHDTWHHILYDLRFKPNAWEYVKECLVGLFASRNPKLGLKTRMMRFVLAVPVYVVSRYEERLPMPANMQTMRDFIACRERMGGTYAEIMQRRRSDPSLDFLRPEARDIFANAD